MKFLLAVGAALAAASPVAIVVETLQAMRDASEEDLEVRLEEVSEAAAA